MRRSFSFLLAATCSLSAIANSGHAESLKGFTEQFKTTQFISDNAEALKFRLALLDNASPGAQVRVATFTYDYGKATQALAAHMCSAVSRGVKVEMIVDSKSGEILGQDNPYNSTDDGKKTEQAYQDLANCGVQIYIHNFTTDFVTISLLGKRIPNIFGNQVQSGSSVNPLSLLSRLKALRARLVQVIQPTLQKNRLSVDPGNVLANVQDLALNLAQFIPEAGNGYKASEDNGTGSPTVDPLESEISTLSSDYRAILNDAFWTQFDSKNPKQSIAKMKSINNAIIHALETDPELKDVRDKLRVFNRLNHRKLFMVQEPNGESCVIIGGRNLGDLYLTNGTLANGTGTYRDGDIFFCKQQSPTSAQFFTEANASLDQLKTDPTDSVMKATGHVVVKLVKATRKIVGAKVASISSTDLKADSLG
ncbi:MAG: hypothetical protein ACXVA9_01630, partial [Bdellovibrionales bacterium]